ncbi:MAG: ATP-binding protein [Desulfovibrio sp.]|nr:ATP-binding protein [Desulfovibrio sp.]
MLDLMQAKYNTVNNIEFVGNPFIEALPAEIQPAEYPKRLFVRPPYCEEDRKRSPAERLQLLQRISQIHVPTKEDSLIMLSLRRCLNWGYVSRNPMSFGPVKEALSKRGFDVDENLLRYFRRFNAPIYGFPILGISGVGKTTSVDNILSLYSQVIEHDEYLGTKLDTRQLVWLKVECPGDGTPKGLCHSILNSIDMSLEEDYTGKIVKNRMSKDVLLIKVSKLLHSLHLGILLIDDIQNLVSAKSDVSGELLSFMVALTNNLRIPVVMIGTPKIIRMLQTEFQMAKRATGEGEIRMGLMEEESREWEVFLKVLWRYQFTANEVILTPSIKKAFFEESIGNPFIAAILYKTVQDDVIINQTETFSEIDIHNVAERKLGLTSKMRKDMLAGTDVELNCYKYLWSALTPLTSTDGSAEPVSAMDKKEDKETLQSELEQNLIQKFNMGIKEARKYSRKAIAAYPDETDLAILTGYVEGLLKEEQA